MLRLPEFHHGEWTVDDYLALPESKVRIEIQDGNLVVTPEPSPRHQRAANGLMFQLHAQVGRTCWVGDQQEIRLGSTSVRIPDVFVARGVPAGPGKQLLRPHDVILAVEVVSPSSHAVDRILKPAEYAAAGIPGFWRVELEPEISLTAYALGENGYDELGTWRTGETAEIAAPLAVTVPIDELS